MNARAPTLPHTSPLAEPVGSPPHGTTRLVLVHYHVGHHPAPQLLGLILEQASDTLLAFSTLSFDIAVLELLLPLTVGAQVVLVSGPVQLPTPAGVQRIDVRSAAQMRDAVLGALPADIYIGAAAVADYTPRQVSPRAIAAFSCSRAASAGLRRPLRCRSRRLTIRTRMRWARRRRVSPAASRWLPHPMAASHPRW